MMSYARWTRAWGWWAREKRLLTSASAAIGTSSSSFRAGEPYHYAFSQALSIITSLSYNLEARSSRTIWTASAGPLMDLENRPNCQNTTVPADEKSHFKLTTLCSNILTPPAMTAYPARYHDIYVSAPLLHHLR